MDEQFTYDIEDVEDEVPEVTNSYVQAKQEVDKAVVNLEVGLELLLQEASPTRQAAHTIVESLPEENENKEDTDLNTSLEKNIKETDSSPVNNKDMNDDEENEPETLKSIMEGMLEDLASISNETMVVSEVPSSQDQEAGTANLENSELASDESNSNTVKTLDSLADKVKSLKLEDISEVEEPEHSVPSLDVNYDHSSSVEEIPVPVTPNKTSGLEAATDNSPTPTGKVQSKELSELDSMLEKCKAIALEKAFHSTLVKDETMCTFLVYCLGEDLEERVVKALQIFHLLSSNPENRPYLSKLPMFFDAVKATALNKKLNKEIREFAVEVYGNVKKIHKPLKAHRANRRPDPGQGPKAKDKDGKSERKPHKAQPEKNQSVSKTTRVSQFYIPQCIFKEKRLKMTEALLTLQGVVSITYDMNKSYCVVRGKPHVPSEVFGTAIANIGYECHMVTKSENNEDILTRIAADSFDMGKSNYDQENVPAPGYCSDSDSDANSPERAQAVALKENEKQKAGWLSSARNLLQRSFYW